MAPHTRFPDSPASWKPDLWRHASQPTLSHPSSGHSRLGRVSWRASPTSPVGNEAARDVATQGLGVKLVPWGQPPNGPPEYERVFNLRGRVRRRCLRPARRHPRRNRGQGGFKHRRWRVIATLWRAGAGHFNPDLVLLAQRRRDLLRHTHQAALEARRLPIGRRPPGRYQPLSRRGQP